MKKRIFSIILSLVIILGAIPIFSLGATAKSGYVARKTSDLGVKFIEAFEGYFQYAYWDYEHYTIGYGTTCKKDEYPAGISEPFAHELLKQKLPSYESGLNSFLSKNNIYVTQNQYDALISFTYNFGANIWSQNPTIAKYLKNGIEKYTDKQIADAFGLWVKAGGQVLQGLVDRRAAEAAFFCTDDFPYNYEMYVVTDSVRLRLGPGTVYSISGSLNRGDLVCVNEKKYVGQSVWGRISANGGYRWFSLEYAKYGNDESPDSSLISTCLYNAENVVGGIKLDWKKVNGASGYKIYRSADGGSSYSHIITINNKNTVSYVDATVSAKRYKYYIIAYNGANSAPRSAISDICYVTAPSLKSLDKVEDGFKISWNKKSGASGYQVLRRAEGDSTYIKLKSVGSSTTSYIDKTPVSGVTYYYTVKSYTSDGLSGAPSPKSGMFLATPEIYYGTNTKKTITVKWNKVLGADGYYVFRKAEGSDTAEQIAQIKKGATVTYTDKNIDAQKSYSYCVKSYTGSVVSAAGSWFTTKVYHPPVINSAKAYSNGIKIQWTKNAEAQTYNIYRKVAGSKTYKKVGSTANDYYEDTGAQSGKTNYYKVTSVVGNNKESYKSAAKSAKYYKKTKITSAVAVQNGVKISWQKVSSAKSYSIYKYSGKKYTLIRTLSGTSYTDTSLGKAKTKTYAVKVNYSGGSSAYSSKFKAYKLSTPKLKVKKTSRGLSLSWNKVKNATGVVIYRKLAGSKNYKTYATLKNFTNTKYLNTSVKSGKTYSYKIKVIRGNSSSMTSNIATKKK